MRSVDLSLILSIIGCITGCASLAINFHKFLTEQFKLKIYFAENGNLFFDKIKASNCKTNFQGIIRINFVNKSSSPVTIYNIETALNNEPIINRKCEFDEITLISDVFTDKKYKSLVFPMDKQIDFPLRIDPFDSYEGYMFFPFFPDTENKIETIHFTFKTTKKIIHNDCEILKFETHIHENCHDDYI